MIVFVFTVYHFYRSIFPFDLHHNFIYLYKYLQNIIILLLPAANQNI